MGFFDDVDGMSIFERNSARLDGVEISQARKLVKQYKAARERLKAQLLIAPDNTFTEARLRSSLLQIEQGIKDLNRQIEPSLFSAFSMLTEEGVEDSARELNALEKKFSGSSAALPIDTIIESTEPENILLNRFETSIQTYGQNLINRIQGGLTQSLLQKRTWTQAVWDMEGLFAEGEEWMLARIVRTELHNIYNVSKMNGFGTIKQDYIPDLMKTLYHPMDSRTGKDSQEAAALNLIVPLDEPFRYKYRGRERVFMVPPDRPNDRAILIPYRKSYGAG